MIKFQKKMTFYPKEIVPVYEFNLPAGHSCPFAKDCKVMVNRKTGKFNIIGQKFRCYASSAERFPGVRESRWRNYEAMLNNEPIIIPKDAKYIRIHSSGDFFSQAYFDKWLAVCRANPNVRFWAFTKSVEYWVKRLDQIPENLVLQASKGGKQDYLIEKYHLKFAEVFEDIKDVPKDLPIDTNDSHAMTGNQSFALLDNFKYSKKENIIKKI